MSRCLIAASILLLPLAAQPAAASSHQQAQQDEESTRVICRSERLTGSRIPSRRICRTAAEWNFRTRVAREGLDNRPNRPVEGSSDAPPAMGGGSSSPFIPPRS